MTHRAGRELHGRLHVPAALQAGWRGSLSTLSRRLQKTGVPYLVRFISEYGTRFRAERFAGNLPQLNQEWKDARDEQEREGIARRIDDIYDSIVLPNGVRKTTFPGRQHDALTRFLAGSDRPPDGSTMRVLDLPASNGAASLGYYRLLARHYRIGAYVPADVCFEVYYDQEHGTVHDESGRVLQVLGPKRFFSIYQSYASGEVFSRLAALVLVPLRLYARRLRRKHDRADVGSLQRIRLIHPELDAMVTQGLCELRPADVFRLDWVDEFDLVISFNLLQRSYFSPAEIDDGITNLVGAMKDGGYLLTGNSEAFGIFRKRSGRLELLFRKGEW